MRIAVAGGSGFIGRHVVRQLREAGHRILVLSRNPGRPDDGVDVQACDLTKGVAPGALAECEAVVNLVGIARPQGTNTFEAAHLEAVKHLIAAAREAGVRRLVHVSVAQAAEALGSYADTKLRGEALVRSSGLEWTILRPSLVYGEGDEALRNIIVGIRAAPVFVVPAGRTGSLQPVDVRDVARAVEYTLTRTAGLHETIDIVGPEDLDLRTLVRRVGTALGLPVRPVPLPRWLMRLAARGMQHVSSNPPLTPAQLEMLVRGLHGDRKPARHLLELEPTPLTAERVRDLAVAVPPPPLSLRLVTSEEHADWLDGFSPFTKRLAWFLPLALLSMLALPWAIPNVWTRMAIINTTLVVLLVATMRGAPWGDLWRPSRRGLAIGIAVAAIMVVGAIGVVALLRLWLPALAGGADQIYAWAGLVSPVAGVPALLALTATEDCIWRGAITLPLCARMGPMAGCIVAGVLCGVAHLTSGPPVLALAALLAGLLWSMLTVRARSLFVTTSCHALWDVSLLLLSP